MLGCDCREFSEVYSISCAYTLGVILSSMGINAVAGFFSETSFVLPTDEGTLVICLEATVATGNHDRQKEIQMDCSKISVCQTCQDGLQFHQWSLRTPM